MTPTTRWRSAAALVLSAVVGASALLAVSSAHAAKLGELTILPAKGNDGSTITALTSGPCPAPATNVIATMYGKGLPAAGQNVIGNSPIKAYPKSADGRIAIGLQYTFGDTAKLMPEPTKLSGTYTIVVTCRGALRPKDVGQYVGSVTFASKRGANGYRAYVAKNPPAPVTPAAASPGAGASAGTTASSSPGSSAGTSNGAQAGGGSSASTAPTTGSSLEANAPGVAGGSPSGVALSGTEPSSSSPLGAVLVGLAVIAALGAAFYFVRSRRSVGR